MSRIFFAEIESAPVARMETGTVVYRGESSFFLERQEVKGRLNTALQKVGLALIGQLVRMEGSWFEDSFEKQSVFLFNRQVLSFDFEDFIHSQKLCAARMYQVEDTMSDVAYLVFGHKSALGSQANVAVDPVKKYGSALLKTFSMRRRTH